MGLGAEGAMVTEVRKGGWVRGPRRDLEAELSADEGEGDGTSDKEVPDAAASETRRAEGTVARGRYFQEPHEN